MRECDKSKVHINSNLYIRVTLNTATLMAYNRVAFTKYTVEMNQFKIV
jgi:hypothetical protein